MKTTSTLTEDASASEPLTISATGSAISENHARHIAREAIKDSEELRALYPGENEFHWRKDVEVSDGEYLVRFERTFPDGDHSIEVRVRKHVKGEKLSPGSLRAMPEYQDGSGTFGQTIGFVMKHIAEDEETARRLRRFIQANYEKLAGLNFSACRWKHQEKWKGKPQIEIHCWSWRGVKVTPDDIADLWPELTWTRIAEDYPSDREIVFHWAAEAEEAWIVLKCAEKEILRPKTVKDGQVVRMPRKESEVAA